MTRIRVAFTVYTALILLAMGTWPGVGQADEWIAETGSYSVDKNWDTGLVPAGEARISNGGSAFIDDSPPELGSLLLGRTAFGGRGTLEIRSGGELFVNGLVHVGGSDFNAANGLGQLRVLRGGELISLTLTSGGDSSSSIVVGQVDGSGTAKFAVDDTATLARNLRIVGPNVEFGASFLNFTPEHTLIEEITGPEHSTISVIEDAMLNDSSLHVVFNGYTPTFDDKWTLLDAFLINGNFGQLSATGLPPGAGVFLSKGSGGENGEIVSLSIGTQLALSVDRRSGRTAIENQAVGETVEISSFAIDGIDGENGVGSKVIGPESSIDLGNLYSFTPSAIGEVGPALAFEYEQGGETIPGRVEFTGPHNNLVLLVDPASGAAAIQNQSIFDAELDGYLITSLSGSLDPEAWLSLAESGRDEWAQANPSAVHLAELNLNSSLSLSADSAPVGIGSPFDFDAEGANQDLAFAFHLAGGNTIAGVVEYGTLDIIINPLDCNSDGVVDGSDLACILAAGGADALGALLNATGLLPGDLDANGQVGFSDFLILSSNFNTTVDSYIAGDIDGNGQVGFSDFLVLSSNFNKSSPAAVSVPEPSAWSLAGLSLLGLLWRRSSSRSAVGGSSLTAASKRTQRPGVAVGLCILALLIVGSVVDSACAQTLTPAKQIFVSDSSDRAMINDDMDPGPLDDDGDIVARERRTITQDNIQIRTFMEFDLSSITSEQVATPGWSAQFLIDFVTRLNTVNDMTVVVGRVLGTSDADNSNGSLGDSWTTEPGSLPLFEWGRTTGESTAPDFEEDRFVVVENVKTDPLGTRQADVTDIVANWVNGVHENNGFSVAGGHDEFQGAGLNNARLVVGLPGDFDGNGVVDLGDFLILADSFAAHLDGPVANGDMDFDGDIDLDDFGLFKGVFQAAQTQGQAQSVPEPVTLMLAVWGILGVAVMRRRR